MNPSKNNGMIGGWGRLIDENCWGNFPEAEKSFKSFRRKIGDDKTGVDRDAERLKIC